MEKWTDQELRALVIQDTAASLREDEHLPEDRQSGRLTYDDGKVYYYVGA